MFKVLCVQNTVQYFNMLLDPLAVKNILHKLLIQNENIPVKGAVDEVWPVQLCEKLQFLILLHAQDENKLVFK